MTDIGCQMAGSSSIRHPITDLGYGYGAILIATVLRFATI